MVGPSREEMEEKTQVPLWTNPEGLYSNRPFKVSKLDQIWRLSTPVTLGLLDSLKGSLCVG